MLGRLDRRFNLRRLWQLWNFRLAPQPFEVQPLETIKVKCAVAAPGFIRGGGMRHIGNRSKS